ncbi:MAG TPA: hypothetical protein VNH46_06260 [Gemmatimonadales bacterium]|nr:hypothetical protein [Gemmatimonadales bacterium]
MKKLAIGCAILAVLLVVGGAVGSYFVYHKVKTAVGGFAELRKVPEIEQSVRKQGPYTPPASGEVSESQLQHFLQVHEAVRARLGARGAEFERQYHDLAQKGSKANVTDAPQLLSAYSDLARVYVDAKRAQADALNQAGLSLDEYHWIRTQAYAALGVPGMDRDLGQIMTEIQEGKTPAPPTMPVGPTGPPATQKLVEPHRKALEDYMPLAFFGL